MLSTLLCLLAPGSSYARTGKTTLALTVLTFGFGWIYLFSATRWIISPNAFIFMNAVLLIIHFSTWAHGTYLALNHKGNIKIKAVFVLYTIAVLMIVAFTHTSKHDLFGFQLYHIPSESMAPTLLVGDVILVDTQFNTEQLEVGQIVVFKRHKKSLTLVKRVSDLQTLEGEKTMFVRGDNATRSIDSRKFGGVSTNYVIGQVTAKLFSLKSQNYKESNYPSTQL